MYSFNIIKSGGNEYGVFIFDDNISDEEVFKTIKKDTFTKSPSGIGLLNDFLWTRGTRNNWVWNGFNRREHQIPLNIKRSKIDEDLIDRYCIKKFLLEKPKTEGERIQEEVLEMFKSLRKD